MSSFTNWFGKLMYKTVAKIFWAYRFCAGCIASNHIKKNQKCGKKERDLGACPEYSRWGQGKKPLKILHFNA